MTLEPEPNGRLQVVAGAIFAGKKVLIGQRLPGGSAGEQWEFPGGKLEPGETHREALAREISEELDLRVSPAEWLARGSARTSAGLIDLDLFAIRLDVVPTLVSSADHLELRWVSANELPHFDWATADRPLIGAVVRALKSEAE